METAERNRQCDCHGCELDGIKNLIEDFRMTPCPVVSNACKTIRRLLKKGFLLKPTSTARADDELTAEGELFGEIVTRDQLIKSLTHTLVLWHPNRVNYIKFILARYRTSIGFHEMYKSHGFYVSDNESIALLRFKISKKLYRLSCYFIDFKTNEIKHTDISMDLTDKEMCSVYLYSGSLWVVQNSEIGVINVAHIRLRDNPVKSFVRNFGTMDYWNPYTPRQVIFTDTELYNEFLRVTLDAKCTKIIRKFVPTLKTSFLIPVGKRQVVIDFDYSAKEVLIQFSTKEDKIKTLRTLVLKKKFELARYTFAFNDTTNLVVVRINRQDVLVLDTINCSLVKTIALNHQYDLNKQIQFLFSPNGKRVLVLGTIINTDQCLWTQHIVCGVKSLKMCALRAARQGFATDDLKKTDMPKILKYELNFGHL